MTHVSPDRLENLKGVGLPLWALTLHLVWVFLKEKCSISRQSVLCHGFRTPLHAMKAVFSLLNLPPFCGHSTVWPHAPESMLCVVLFQSWNLSFSAVSVSTDSWQFFRSPPVFPTLFHVHSLLPSWPPSLCIMLSWGAFICRLALYFMALLFFFKIYFVTTVQ